ncbi:hypothetical protein BESB_077690 [Besnoitia besnoiti]|uniref:Uncharacterized protein n=1 Tax=Besnoitia besnoiti TaxID=94643 RepID=A0A2A9MDU1_BESBE|nr:hypothetical protein BESB_077690 [Besnoitia besnoiti]PFH33552.1 hypothetical protein BESB_077690 [Besnoitia besnoiti]
MPSACCHPLPITNGGATPLLPSRDLDPDMSGDYKVVSQPEGVRGRVSDEPNAAALQARVGSLTEAASYSPAGYHEATGSPAQLADEGGAQEVVAPPLSHVWERILESRIHTERALLARAQTLGVAPSVGVGETEDAVSSGGAGDAQEASFSGAFLEEMALQPGPSTPPLPLAPQVWPETLAEDVTVERLTPAEAPVADAGVMDVEASDGAPELARGLCCSALLPQTETGLHLMHETGAAVFWPESDAHDCQGRSRVSQKEEPKNPPGGEKVPDPGLLKQLLGDLADDGRFTPMGEEAHWWPVELGSHFGCGEGTLYSGSAASSAARPAARVGQVPEGSEGASAATVSVSGPCTQGVHVPPDDKGSPSPCTQNLSPVSHRVGAAAETVSQTPTGIPMIRTGEEPTQHAVRGRARWETWQSGREVRRGQTTQAKPGATPVQGQSTYNVRVDPKHY